MKLFYCSFCELSFYTLTGLAQHFLEDHYYNPEKKLSTCPVCSFVSTDIYSHIKECHSNCCSFCALLMHPKNNHSNCESVLEKIRKKMLVVDIKAKN